MPKTLPDITYTSINDNKYNPTRDKLGRVTDIRSIFTT